MKEKITNKLLLILLTCSTLIPTYGQQQQTTVQGTVMDAETDVPIPGATVVEKGKPNGALTDFDGKFILGVTRGAVLQISFMGYATAEIEVGDQKEFVIPLMPQAAQLDEVVLVGYNTVQREHIASSVAELDMDLINQRPISKLQEAFSGTIPGVTMLQGSNLPGSVPGDINIRGIATLQNSSPLVIIDGMEQSLTDVDPNQVASITVLKDAASASMYGSRGANGVIIIETKRGGAGEFNVNIHSWAAVNDPIDLPDFVNSADYMRLNNEARYVQGETLLFSQEDINLAQSGEYTNTNWLEEITQRTSFSHNTSASISGGGGIGTFNLMVGYMEEAGLNEGEGSQKFSARFNTNIQISEDFVLLADFYAHQLQVDRLWAATNGHGLYNEAWRMNPTQAVTYESDIEDHYILHNNLNPVARMNQGGYWNALHDRSTVNLRPTYTINDKLSVQGNVSYLLNKSANKWERETFRFFDGDGRLVDVWGNAVGAEQGVSSSQITARGLINFESGLRDGKDRIYLVGGAEMMNYNYTDFREVAKASFFGKLNYSFDNRYILEATVRKDGSSKFAPGYQWGFFPSGAVSWNLHNEGFLSGMVESGVINRLRLRGSFGLIGNEDVDPYLWEESVNTWGWTMRVPNPQFSWEKQEQWNVGLNASILDNKLSVTADVYNKRSYDLIYGAFPVPPLTGSYYLTTSVNIGEVENRGWEVGATWSDQIGEFSYTVGGMMFDNQNEVLKAGYSKSDTLIFRDNTDKIWYQGIGIDNFYGYESDGFFQTAEEIESSASLPNTRQGDIKYVDQNEDGIINDKDRVNLGDPFPHLNYSINLTMNYRRWEFRFLGQGVGERLGRLNGLEGYPVVMDGSANNLGTPRQYYAANRWTPETPNSRFPRMWTGNSSNAVLSDVWLSDASFFRIKTLRLGYTIPSIGTQINNLNIYVNAQDAFTFSNWEGLEPERDGGNGGYPRMASYSLGFRATLF
ncbi:SusC/RagA family TonB-linked outer membrane protein [Antarcticibacterium sp. 1MA-6-2]|uniref:SusC/RagA family TonB-linked outer membrane protein n=1 Tax=Antarcticibacterium sp. 1MA-6-2 TaxID=2908210 RepID=UPI001F212642|nr:SusC/RagA family TonB-linked outer membrane protein [Antarcticibacterium sp. 1MA-6-2]UJH90160.1 SusC/RagA family TonB-linked outer membrane protein [Antarcticibacterium sp. 1MA-6-2]